MTDPPRPQDELVAGDDAIIGRAFRASLAVIGVIAVVVVATVLLRGGDEETEDPIERDPIVAPDRLVQTAADRITVPFTNITESAGVDFVHTNGATGEKLLPETMGGGCAFLDYDGDEDPDLLLVDSDAWPHDTDATSGRTRLYRNDGTGRFDDVSLEAGFDFEAYGMGVACGDYDGDGDVDLFLTAVGPNRLLRNDGGVFTDVTDTAGVRGPDDAWSTSAGFFDHDGDGDLDLFVCNYVSWSRDIDIELNFSLNGTDRAYGPPKLYAGVDCELYRNDGAVFTDVSEDAGIRIRNAATGVPASKALAVTFSDIDRDGWLDVLVANDTVKNFVFRNMGDGTFSEVGVVTGIALSQAGTATGAMGIDAATYANDETIGVAIGNFANEATSFYVQQSGSPWTFVDLASAEGIGSPSLLKLSFGLFFFDYDLDGRLDFLQANGHLEDEINEIQPSQFYRQAPQLFWNCGPGDHACFAAVPEDELGELAAGIVGRGAAYADIDGDGDLDILLTQIGGPPVLARNDQTLGRHWLRVRLVGPRGNTDAIGARVELTSGDLVQERSVMPTRSYLSQVELPLTFGIGDRETIDRMVVIWPDGTRQEISVEDIDRQITVEYAGKVTRRD